MIVRKLRKRIQDYFVNQWLNDLADYHKGFVSVKLSIAEANEVTNDTGTCLFGKVSEAYSVPRNEVITDPDKIPF